MQPAFAMWQKVFSLVLVPSNYDAKLTTQSYVRMNICLCLLNNDVDYDILKIDFGILK